MNSPYRQDSRGLTHLQAFSNRSLPNSTNSNETFFHLNPASNLSWNDHNRVHAGEQDRDGIITVIRFNYDKATSDNERKVLSRFNRCCFFHRKVINKRTIIDARPDLTVQHCWTFNAKTFLKRLALPLGSVIQNVNCTAPTMFLLAVAKGQTSLQINSVEIWIIKTIYNQHRRSCILIKNCAAHVSPRTYFPCSF